MRLKCSCRGGRRFSLELSAGCRMHRPTQFHSAAEQPWSKLRIFVKACVSRSLCTDPFCCLAAHSTHQLQALLGTPTTATPPSSHLSRRRSCLFQSEQSAGSLSQSEGIQSASGAEYQAGCCRGSSCSTDTVDSSALFMGPAGACEMASAFPHSSTFLRLA